MFFRSLFKPKWEHHNPEVRKRAVAGLDTGQQQSRSILAQVARHDGEPDVRRVAIRRLADLDLLEDIARTDPDPGVRELASQRFCQLLAGTGMDCPELGRRMEALAQVSEARVIEYIAQHGREPELRLAALARVEREPLLGDLAIEDMDARVRLAALDRITQRSTLERVVRMTRNRDKRVSRLARERLTALIEELERPARRRAEREHLCVNVEALGRLGNWERDAPAFERLHAQWQSLEGAPEEDLAQRFQQARERFLAGLQAQRAAGEQRSREEQALAPLREQKTALCEAAEELLRDLQRRERLDPEAESSVSTALAEMQARWEQAARLPEPEERQMQARFTHACKAVRNRQQELARFREVEARLSELTARAQGMKKSSRPLQERQVKDLEREWHAVEQPPGMASAQELERGFEQIMAVLRTRLREEREEREQGLEKLAQLLPEAEAALEAGELKNSKALLEQAHKIAKTLVGAPPERLGPLEARLQAASAKARELQDWQRWANTREKERLCTEVEALIGQEMEPLELDRLIRQARTSWKRLAASEPESAQVLWERFNTACTRAYEPCHAHFEEQAHQRQAHLAKKQEMCERLEAFAGSADWTNMDWKGLERLIRDSRQEWNAIGPVDRKLRAELQKRFDTVMDALARQLTEERERNRGAKLALVERIEAAKDIDDVREAVKQVKQLQNDWKNIGPAARRDEQELWNRFRAACDVVFERRNQQKEAAEAERRANLERKNALCAQVEDLASLPDESLASAQGQVRKVQAEWDTVGPVPKEEAEAVENRFAQACERFSERQRAYIEATEQDELVRVKQKAGLCAELEALADANDAGAELARERVDAARGAWELIPPLQDHLEQPMLKRFQRACSLALTAPGEQPADLAQERQGNLKAKETLCIRMELLAGIDSPPEASEARLRYQVSQLSQGMRQGRGDRERRGQPSRRPRDEALHIELAWYQIGILPPGCAEPLQRRFQHARDAFYRPLYHQGQEEAAPAP